MSDINIEKWVSLEDVSRHLGVSKDTIYRWIKRRQLPAHKIGRLWKFKRDEVDNWAKNYGETEDE